MKRHDPIYGVGYDYPPMIINPYSFASASADIYSGAAGIFALRALNGWSTAVVRVKRSSDSVEADFTAAEITDDTLTDWTGANDGRVVTWYDQSGNGRNMTATTGPKLVDAGTLQTQGGRPTLVFAGANERFERTGMSLTITAQSTFVIARDTAGSASARLFTQNDAATETAAGGYIPLLLVNSTSIRSWEGSGKASVTFTASTLFTASSIHSGTQISNRANLGSPVTAASTITKTFTRWSFGASFTDSARWTGQISEVVTFLSDVGTTLRDDIQQDQKTYVGL